MIDVLIDWAIRIALAMLAFLVVRWGLPLLLGLGGISIPDNIVILLAVIFALIVLAGHYRYFRRGPPAP